MPDLPMPTSFAQWLVVMGLGCLWLGAQIVWVAPTPRQLRRGDVPTAPPGTEKAFALFWIDQYGWIGLTLCVLGSALIGTALVESGGHL